MKVYNYLEFCKSSVFYQMDFEGWLKRHYNTQCINALNFYDQPFKPELITELFVGWREVPMGYFGNPMKNPPIVIYETDIDKIEFDTDGGDYSIIPKKNKHDIRYNFFPRTLDDFINDCQRAGIELTWRTK